MIGCAAEKNNSVEAGYSVHIMHIFRVPSLEAYSISKYDEICNYTYECETCDIDLER